MKRQTSKSKSKKVVSTTINISTNAGNIIGAKINKLQKDITFKDVLKVATKEKGKDIIVRGWA